MHPSEKETPRRVVELIKADGDRVRLEYEADGRLRRLDASDVWFETEVSQGAGPAVRVRDPRGHTDVDVSRRGWAITRGDAELCIETDAKGRPRRIRIPGSDLPLELKHSKRGCVLRYGERTLARLVEGGDRRRWHVGSVLLEERCERPRWTLAAWTATEVRRGGPSGPPSSCPLPTARCPLPREDSRRELTIWTDLLGRTVRRAWDDGVEERFARDSQGRLTEHRRRACREGNWDVCELGYWRGELLETRSAGGVEVRRTGEGGRVLAIDRTGGESIRYGYDARGRRTARYGPGGITRYAYDGLDRLVRVERPDGGVIESSYDGLGRRIETHGPEGPRIEHRDAEGRLWAVAGGDGRTLATYVWYENRPLLQFNGPLDAPECTAYLCDPLGTPLLAAVIDGGGHPRIERLDVPLFGSAHDARRPTIYGHVGDPRTGLVHFGARDLDPETGAFLTPEPWHGGPDDERRFGGAAPGGPGWVEESVASRRHDYALCRFDPVGRADYDGHVSGGAVAAAIFRGLGNLILGPTWGMPLTSISLFFFLPFNLYAEIIAGIIAIFIQRHPWKNHSIFGLQFLMGSLRQGQISFALNGFLPRVISGGGIHSDRAVTIGNVIWIHRHELNVLNRAMVIEVDDIAGSGGATAFNNNSSRVSIVALDIKDSDGKLKVHVTYWTRGYGNAIKTVGAPANPRLAFDDRPVGGKRTAPMVLTHPVPLAYDAPDETDDDEKLVVRELVHQSATNPHSTARVIDDVWFVLRLEQNKKEKLKNGDAIEIEAEATPPVDSAHMVIGKVQNNDDFSLVFLFGELPARFQTANITEKMTVHRIVDDGSRAATDGWQDVVGATPTLEAADPGAAKPWPPPLESDDLIKITAATAAAPVATVGFPSPPSRDTVHARIKKLVATLEVADALPGGLAATDVLIMNGTGTVQNAKLKDKSKDTEIEFVADPNGISQGDFVSVRLSGTATETYAAIALNGKVATLTYLAAKPAYAGPTDLQIRKLVDRSDSKDPKGTAASPSGTSFGVEVPRFKAFAPDVVIHLKSGGTDAIRKITKVATARVELSDAVLGTKPFTVSLAKRDPALCRIKDVTRPKLQRFLQHVLGADPSAYHSYPDCVLEVSLNPVLPLISAFFLRGAAGLHESYKLTWTPLEFGAHKYFVLDSDLPIDDHLSSPGDFVWKYDPDDPDFHAFRLINIGVKPAGGFVVQLREFQASGAERGQPVSVTAHPAEVLVPADPQFRYSLGDALSEHEMHHTLQGNYYGPFLGAFPLQALILSVTDLAELNDSVDTPGWFRDIPSDFFGGELGLSVWQTFSIGGIMYFAWKFLFLPPAYFSEDARNEILHANFSSFNRIFNPFWGNLIAKFPQIDPNLTQRDSEPGVVIARLIARAMDLRSWTPFLGFVPTWLPDGPQNFIEQGASRMSGDMYSTVLSTDDKFNAKLSMRIGDSLVRDDHGADVEKPLGSVFRLMLYPGDRWDRIFHFNRADQPADPDLPVTNNTEFATHPIVRITAPQDTLFHPDFYEVSGPTGTLKIEGPTSNPGPVDFLTFPPPAVGTFAQPTLRNLVPMPPRINRTAGMYFIASQPAEYTCKAHERKAGTPEDAGTQNVTLKVTGKVALGDDDIPWQTPAAHGVVPVGPKVERFITETAALTMKNHKDDLVETRGFEERLDVTAGAAAKAKVTLAKKQWDVVAGDTPATLRIRLYRIFKKNDPADDSKNEPAFDLMFGSIDTLKNVRSYLEKDAWVLVRDFLVDVKPLPPLGNQTKKYDEAVEVELPLDVAPSAITITPPAGAPRFPNPSKKGKGPTHPRGHMWRFGPLDTVVEEAVTYKVEVTFGTGGVTAKGNFDLVIQPIIRLTAGGAFQAVKGTPLELAIVDGAAPFSLDTDNLPAGTVAAIDSPNRKVTITVNDSPPGATKVVVTVTDANGKKGRRTVTAQ